MHNTLSLTPMGTPDLEINPSFSVVIAYEDFETGKHAKKIYDYLAEHLKHEIQFTHQMWKFDVLAVSKLREMAAKDAARADIIIVSAHGARELPAEVKAWTEQWLTERSGAIALVALFDSEEHAENPARDYLAAVARRAQMEFFSQPGIWPGRNEGRSLGDWDVNGRTFSALAGVVQQGRDISHWGINE